MSVISMKQLLEAGVHFGHQTRRWNPKMAPYIFTERNGIHIIDLQKSVGKIDEAYNAVSEIAAQGGTILFVGTKKQAQDAVKAEAERCGMFYVNERWLGGMLTNFKTIRSRIERLKQIETMSEDGTFDVLPKKEVIKIKKEWEKLEKNLGGIKNMTRIPDAIFVVDPKKERICVQEASSVAIGVNSVPLAPTTIHHHWLRLRAFAEIFSVGRSFTGWASGEWMLAAANGNGYTAYTRPGHSHLLLVFVALLNCLSLTLKQQQILILLELNAGCHNRLLSVIRIC